MLRDQGRVSYRYATDDAALQAFAWLSRSEGLLPALESAHAIAAVRDVAAEIGRDGILVVNLSGRGDKDVHLVGGLVAPAAEARS